MHSNSQRYTMVYNGEIYNFKKLRQQLSAQGSIFKGHSDSEVLLAAFSQWGIEKTLDQINGMFAIALFDRDENILYLLRDRIGQKPLYYARFDQTILFGSELKALKKHPQFVANINRDALAEYSRFCYVPDPLSIYQKTYKLPPGHFIRIHIDESVVTDPICYWDHQAIIHSQENTFLGTFEEAEEGLHRLLLDAVEARMLSDVPLGAFLSGGIDSSLIVALMQSQSKDPIKTFTIGFNQQAFNEAEEAKSVAHYLGTEHAELYVSPEKAQSVIPLLSTIYDEPFSDSSQIPTFLVAELAKQQVSVALTGDGGDEFFAGYHRHYWVPLFWKRFGCLPSYIKKPLLKCLTLLPANRWGQVFSMLHQIGLKSLSARRIGNKIHKAAAMLSHQCPSGMYLDLVSSWKVPSDVILGAADSLAEYYHDFFQSNSLGLVSQMLSLDARYYLPNDILVKVDRAAMAVSLEPRSPMLDHRVVEFAWSLPLAYKLQGRSGKLILKKLLSRYLPEHLIDRPKMGFSVPLSDWLRGPLRQWADDLLDPSVIRQQGFFNARFNSE